MTIREYQSGTIMYECKRLGYREETPEWGQCLNEHYLMVQRVQGNSPAAQPPNQSPAAEQDLAYCEAIRRQYGLDPNLKEMEVCRQRAIIAAQQVARTSAGSGSGPGTGASRSGHRQRAATDARCCERLCTGSCRCSSRSPAYDHLQRQHGRRLLERHLPVKPKAARVLWR